MTNKLAKATLLSAGLMAVLALASCSNQSDPLPFDGKPNATLSAEQRKALADGKVTYGEYQAGFRRFTACDSKRGYQVEVEGESNEVFDYRVPDKAVDSGVNDACYDREFGQLDRIWQVSRQNTSDTARALRSCLSAKGVTVPKDYAALVKAVIAAGLSPDKCVQQYGP